MLLDNPAKNELLIRGYRKMLAEQSLHDFVRLAWHVLEPETVYVDGWHIECICKHLQAVSFGTLSPRVLINIPPGHMKSLLVSVFWQAWEWGPLNRAHLRYLTTSYSEKYSTRDARKTRDLVNSEWYQQQWGNRFKLTRSGETSFANDKGGTREAVPFASLTAGRGDRVIIDDPHSTETAESEAERERTTRIFKESVTTRLNDPQKSAIVIIMQRLHSMDVSAEAIAQKCYVHIMLPVEFEPERKCKTPLFDDPRTTDGELLFPQRFTKEVVERDKSNMGIYAVAGQFQQRPSPRGGGMFKREWFEVKTVCPPIKKLVRFWDKAGTSGGQGARTAGVLIGEYDDVSVTEGSPLRTKYIVLNIVTGRWEAAEREAVIQQTAHADKAKHGWVEIWVEQEPGSGGKESAESTIANLVGFSCKAERVTGDKETRAEPLAAQASVQRIKLLQASWNEEFLEEVCMFPVGKLRDVVDAAGGAFNKLWQPGGGIGSASEIRASRQASPFEVTRTGADFF
jgi:predicted phage terminase large subunit-like protein